MDDETRKRLELLKIARQELGTQYIKDRADAYTQWTIDCDQAWRENGIKLSFPPPPPMPTESDIVAYALALYNAQNLPAAAPVALPPPVHTVVETVAETVIPTPKIEPAPVAASPVPVIEPPPAPTMANVAVEVSNAQIPKLPETQLASSLPTVTNTPPAPANTGAKGVLPAWLQRLHGIGKE